jgi:hypothetical protein
MIGKFSSFLLKSLGVGIFVWLAWVFYPLAVSQLTGHYRVRLATVLQYDREKQPENGALKIWEVAVPNDIALISQVYSPSSVSQINAHSRPGQQMLKPSISGRNLVPLAASLDNNGSKFRLVGLGQNNSSSSIRIMLTLSNDLLPLQLRGSNQCASAQNIPDQANKRRSANCSVEQSGCPVMLGYRGWSVEAYYNPTHATLSKKIQLPPLSVLCEAVVEFLDQNTVAISDLSEK